MCRATLRDVPTAPLPTTQERLTVEIVGLLYLITQQLEQLMATEADLQATVDQIQSGVAAGVAALDTLAAKIADLTAQLAAGNLVTQDQLDALNTELSTARDALASAVTRDNPPA